MIAGMFRRAAPRVGAVLLLVAASSAVAAMTTGAVASVVHWAGFVLTFAAAGSKHWWRYVRHGEPAPWRVEHEGTAAPFVTDPGRDRTGSRPRPSWARDVSSR
ncbi:hypothetical protein ACQPZX_16830 [Actinoplanes sp. CA-142083]|uniref:hypothetical protein n=1 Tax=Actinoplanes sp. CA-142083 TaxID=3239903 RepID=UPI003D90CEA7